MSEDTTDETEGNTTENKQSEPWYVTHSKSPEGSYGANLFRRPAKDNPENRHGVGLHHHTDYADTDLQRNIAEGLSILRDNENAEARTLMVGGDVERGDNKGEWYYVRWDATEQEYLMVKEGKRKRTSYIGLLQVMNALDEKFNDDSFVCVMLQYVRNSPFNLPEEYEKTGGRVLIAA